MIMTPECCKVAAGADEPLRHAVATQHFDGAVDRKALGNTAEIDQHVAVGEADIIVWEKLSPVRGAARLANTSPGGGRSARKQSAASSSEVRDAAADICGPG